MQSNPKKSVNLWLRSEHKPHEARTPITPRSAKILVDAGYTLKVERSESRAFADEAYADAGCDLVAEFAWREAPADYIVVGLKELSADLGPFVHRHIHFAHVYKNQDGWQGFLEQFSLGGGLLYDLEYLVDEQGRRVAAFGYWAGYVGAAIALLQWAAQQSGSNLEALQPWQSRDALQQTVSTSLKPFLSELPKAMVIGAKGRSGGGAVELLERCGVKVTQWDQAETANGGPFDDVLEHQILVNCVFLNSPIAPFTTINHLQQSSRQLSVVCDVSCDPFSDANPLPIYNECTTMHTPSIRILNDENGALDLISIDHLPSLLPVESSNEFADALLPFLLEIDQPEKSVWHRAQAVFEQKCAEAQHGEKL